MKIVNTDREILHNFWTTWGILMKFFGKMWLMKMLKVTGNPRVHPHFLSLKDWRFLTGFFGFLDSLKTSIFSFNLICFPSASSGAKLL